ncbi:tetratricopeptide repeat protein [Sphingobium sp. H33]|uniref:Tetratricopeptide repeat protein n=2 Tax=Sphingobium nicotianae TaxID=2782607 RepID=A0A9X1IS10_9SPHN|nr:tetratricopeptide repeat protein [Sphingobium nicotianae]
MGPDDDLAKLLPEAPPRPDRREAAIAEAMRRFDGEAPTSIARRPRFAWPKLGRTQLGAAMSVALLAAIGVPLALRTMQTEELGLRSPPKPHHASERASPSPVATRAAPAGRDQPPPAQAAPAPATAVPAKEAPRALRGMTASEEPSSQDAQPETAFAPAAPPPPPPPPAPPPPPPPAAVASSAKASAPRARAPAAEQDVVVTGTRLAGRVSDTPVAITAAGESEAGATEIVVTSGRISRAESKAAQRGDWNACTVDDPARSLDRCRRVTKPGAKDNVGQAAAHMADGLTHAWTRDMDGAVAAFDAAIAIDPKSASAYLNRGMAYHHLGEDERAVRDFDQAVRYAPRDPRGFYHRSIALRALGDERRAGADQARAVSLDGRYEELVD